MEGVKCSAFMSGQDNLYLGTIGLLGEYCPTSKKKFRHTLERLGCMHLEPFGNLALLQGCNQVQPSFAVFAQSSIEEGIVFASSVSCI